VKRFFMAAALLLPLTLFGFAYVIAHRARGLQPGESFPLAQLETLSGAPVHTGQWRGRATLLVIFRSTCEACRRKIRSLPELRKQMPELGIELLSVDGKAIPGTTPFQVLRDPDGAFLRRVRRLSVPLAYLIDSSGIVRHAGTGAGPGNEAASYRSLLSKPRSH
jgi:hypothetical protein